MMDKYPRDIKLLTLLRKHRIIVQAGEYYWDRVFFATSPLI